MPYPWNLLTYNNYQNWRLFSAYLVYNYRGNDTLATLAGFSDDLMYRWAKIGKRMTVLRDQLSDANCAECARKSYFRRNGQPLDVAGRLAVLMHNWRVANYVNRPFLADSQYGFPPQFKFAPKRDLRPWQGVYNDSSTLTVAIPPELVMTPSAQTVVLTRAGQRYLGTKSHPMSFYPTGSEYWVLRASGLSAQNPPTLVVSVDPESIYRSVDGNCIAHDGRLIASVVKYNVSPPDSLADGRLWAHPEWATSVTDPQWVDVDSVAGGLEFALPGFGQSFNAAVVVLSLADGPSQGWTEASEDVASADFSTLVLPYRITAGLRTAPYESPSPRLLVRTAGAPDDHAAWSPAGTEIAFDASIASQSVLSQIYRVPAGGGSPTRLFPQGAAQFELDWSPRGDWVAFGQDSGAYQYQRDVWLYNVQTSESRRLTFKGGHARVPAFSPNAQAVAYARYPFIVGHQFYETCELRKINFDGSGDVALASFSTADSISCVRWSPDGTLIYFTRNDSLYSIPAGGGSIVARVRLAPNATSFDFEPGSRQTLFEQAKSYKHSGGCPPTQNFYMPFRRIALRDTLNGDTRGRFYMTGAEFFHPRWSPDGTRIAYSSDQNAPGDRDLFVGQVSWNHAPKYVNAPRDTVLVGSCPGGTFTRTFTATDPDGEALTYSAVYLPPGASLTSQGVFTWPDPGLPGSEYFVVFRVLDGSGGLDQRVVRYAVAADPARPAAVLDETPSMGKTSAVVNWTDVGDDSLTGNACRVRIRYGTSAITEANFFASDDTIPNPGAPGPAGTVHCAELANGALSSCTWYYFGTKTRDDAGNWSALSNVASGKTKCSGFTEVTCYGDGGGALMAQSGGGGGWSIENGVLGQAIADSMRSDCHHVRRNSSAAGQARVRLTRRGGTGVSLDLVELTTVDHAPEQSLFLAGNTILAGTLSDVEQVTDGGGNNVTSSLAAGNDVVTAPAGSRWEVQLGTNLTGAQAFYLDAAGGTTIAPITVQSESSPGVWQAIATLTPRWGFDPLVVEARGASKARFTFANETTIRRVARVSVASQAQPQTLALASAQHSTLGSVVAALAAEGGTEALLKPGEHVVLEYAEPSLAAGAVRDYFLGVRGRRVSLTGSSTQREGRTEAQPEKPLVFALHQAEPTPFSQLTRIRFDLPAPA